MRILRLPVSTAAVSTATGATATTAGVPVESNTDKIIELSMVFPIIIKNCSIGIK
jgi:hypothetical protein